MHPLTAICLLAISGSLILTNHCRFALGRSLAGIPLLIGLLMLIKRLTGWGPNLHSLFFSQQLQADSVGNLSNLMALHTAFCLLVLGVVLTGLGGSGRRIRVAQGLALLVGAISLLTLFGYTYGVQAFYGALASYPMAIHTAGCILGLSLASLLARADQGFMIQIASPLAGARFGRSLLVVALIVPVGVGLLALNGYWRGLFTTELAMAFFAAVLTTILVALIWYNIRRLNQTDAQQQQDAATLRQQEEQIQSIFGAAPDAVLVFDQQGQLITWNTQATHVLGVSQQTQHVGSLFTPAAYIDFQRSLAILKVTTDRFKNLSLELTALTPQQQPFPASLSLSHTQVQGKPLFIGFLRDITQQRVAAQQLQQVNADLVRSNTSLQQFASVASHDLQEPLRKIESFGVLLKNQHSDQLGDGVLYLDRMQTAARRMATLIRDLLTFSQINTQPTSQQDVSLKQLLRTVISNLELSIEEAEAVVVVDDLPTVGGDASQLGQLFQNLLSNGLKFRRPGVTPELTVRSRSVAAADLPAHVKPALEVSAYTCIEVTDNGIGFDEQYLDRMFQMFGRLHGKQAFAGTGIGLAICERVAAIHGGAITASSQPGQGATFSVYLPVQ
ncbi:sensor histidine kinase [Fibrivirga algicola]|uniref:histidine kinase n=1 Tax=Fibrivirga algicola TaxID=2950420 RepID=A0ABX0QMR1_9BACT|nr:PAS domain-containing sensor histidine kinase [Fibrivirga algicola]NID12450.1 PAS domain S-box protein [Fibrivirga algicola]